MNKVPRLSWPRYSTESFYRVVKRNILLLPEDPARVGRNQAEVVLAFPVDVHSVPIIRQQYVFSFLPLCQVGFSVCHSIPRSSRFVYSSDAVLDPVRFYHPSQSRVYPSMSVERRTPWRGCRNFPRCGATILRTSFTSILVGEICAWGQHFWSLLGST